jgi:N-methylhydantoinase A
VAQEKNLRIGVDVGGTFTDVVGLDHLGGSFFTKVPSTPENQSIGVVHGITKLLQEMGAASGDVLQVAHGTTVATNALLERAGARTGLLTTAGFRDVLHIGRQDRPALYDLSARRPDPLVPRHLRHEVDERVLHTGEVRRPVDMDGLERAIAALLADGVESLAVCFLHAYANPSHEQQALAAIRRLAPQLNVSLSSEILPEFREFERTSTTVVNAYVQKTMERYLSRLADGFAGASLQAPLMVMQSNGGMMTAEAAATRSVNTLLSGPAGGVMAATNLSALLGGRNVITADVGGTSFDVALVENGRPVLRREGVIEGFPVKFPHIDIHTIGAGGGSIAWIDTGGGLRVGPRSAGAKPGPVCYGRGGVEPTVCDAFATLGWLGAGSLLAGEMRLDVATAREAIRTRIAAPLGLSIEAAAEGILRVANAAMCGAIRVLTVERGSDPRRFSLLPFGGSGPLHAAELARALGMRSVLVPIAPGNFSAFGVLAAPVRCDEVAVCRMRDGAVDLPRLQALCDELGARAVARLVAQTCPAEAVVQERGLDLRYVGQAFELTVPLAADAVSAASWVAAVEAFHALHETLYGFARRDSAVEAVNLRVTGIYPVALPAPRPAQAHAGDTEGRPFEQRQVYFAGHWHDTAIYRRADLRPGQQVAGPAVLEEKGSTFVLCPEDSLQVDALGNLEATIGGSASA